MLHYRIEISTNDLFLNREYHNMLLNFIVRDLGSVEGAKLFLAIWIFGAHTHHSTRRTYVRTCSNDVSNYIGLPATL